MLVVANLTISKYIIKIKKDRKMNETLVHGCLRGLNESYTMRGFKLFSKIFASLDESSLIIQKIKDNVAQ